MTGNPMAHSEPNSSLGKQGFARRDLPILVFVALCVSFCIAGLSQLQTDTEDVLQWLPDKSTARQEYDQFEKKFGSDDFLIVTWDQCTVDDPRLADFSKSLADSDSDQLIQSVVDGSGIAEKLSQELSLSSQQIARRFRGLFFGVEDLNQTLAIVELTKKGSANRRLAFQLVNQVIDRVSGLSQDDVIFGGYPYLGINIDDQIRISLEYLLLPSFLLATFVSLLCLRSFALMLIVFLTALGASACSVAIVPICGVKFGGLMAIIPALVFVLATSGSLHLIRYSLDSIGHPGKLISIGWKPCAISSLTTAIGMLSLAQSSFPAIRHFGFFCATGAAFALVFQLIMIPWLLTRFGAKGQRKLASRANSNRAWPTLANWIARRKFSIATVGIASMLIAAFGLPRLIARVDVDMLFGRNSEIITSLARLEARMGPIDQSEFLITFDDVDVDDVDQQPFHTRANLVREIQQALVSLPTVGTTHSLQNYIPRQPTGTRIRSSARRAVYQKKLDRARDRLATSRFLHVDESSETWRISLRFPFAEESDVKKQKELAIAAATSVVEKWTADAKLEVAPHFVYTGKNHLFHTAQSTLLEDLFRNFLMAFAIITPVLIVVLRSLSLGLIAMVPNLFPIVLMFGVLGWLHWPVDLAIAMTACIALGIAVDDTTHFLMRFRDFGGSLSNVVNPIALALTQCGPAMFHTTAIGGAGLIAFGFSEMLVIRNFSWAITLMLIIALVADIFLLPALLLQIGRSRAAPMVQPTTPAKQTDAT